MAGQFYIKLLVASVHNLRGMLIFFVKRRRKNDGWSLLLVGAEW